MKTLKTLLLALASCSLPASCFGQASWLDFSSAIPKITFPGGNPNFNMPSQGFPSTSGYQGSTNTNANLSPSNSGGSNSGGFNPGGFNSGGFSGAGPMLSPARKDWKLGVYVQNTEAGAVITQIAPGSSGQQAGLQPNDVIVAVGGSRIGNFDNRIVELADEIRRYTDPMGRVSLLVYNSSQRTLVSMPVSMNSNSSTLTGIVTTRDRMQLPYGATLMVQLQNMTKPYSEIAGGKSVTSADGFGPFQFELHFDPRYIDPRDQYQLSASISVGNQLAYGLFQPVQVDVNNLGQPLNLLLERSSNGQSYGNPNQPNYNPGIQGNVISAGYSGNSGPNVLNDLFLQLLGRAPSAAEVVAWQSYLQQGNSINDLTIKLMSNYKFRERFQNDSLYVQQLMTSLTGRAPNQQELAFWMSRLQSTGSPEVVISEILQKNR